MKSPPLINYKHSRPLITQFLTKLFVLHTKIFSEIRLNRLEHFLFFNSFVPTKIVASKIKIYHNFEQRVKANHQL